MRKERTEKNKMKLHNEDIKETNHLIAYIERLDSVV